MCGRTRFLSRLGARRFPQRGAWYVVRRTITLSRVQAVYDFKNRLSNTILARRMVLLGLSCCSSSLLWLCLDMVRNRAYASCAVDGLDPLHPHEVFDCPGEIMTTSQAIWSGCNRHIRVDVVEWSFESACKQVPPCAALTCPQCPDGSCKNCWNTGSDVAVEAWDDALEYYRNPNLIGVGSGGDIVFRMLTTEEFDRRFGTGDDLIAVTRPIAITTDEICCGTINAIQSARIFVRHIPTWTLNNDNAGGSRLGTTHGARRFAVHEIGHALMLDHGGGANTSIMSFSANGNAPKSLDLLAMKCLYAKSFTCCNR